MIRPMVGGCVACLGVVLAVEAGAQAVNPPVGPHSRAVTLPELIRRIKPGVATVLVYDLTDTVIAQGTGFFIGPGQLVTNAHVIEGAHRAELKIASGRTLRVAGVLAEDLTYDLSILGSDVGGQDASVLDLAPPNHVVAQGDRVYVLGSPHGLEFTLSEGLVSAVREAPGVGVVLQISAPVSPGSSGSPVFDANGLVVGLVRAQVIDGQALNFAVPVDRVRTLTPGLPRAFRTAPPIPAKGRFERLAPPAAETRRRLLADLRRAAEHDPADASFPFAIGFVLMVEERWMEALEAYRQAVRLDPGMAEARHGLGEVLGALGRWVEAAQEFKEAIRLKPDWAEAHEDAGEAFSELRQWAEAAQAFNESLRLKPDTASAHYRLGTVYTRMGLLQRVSRP